jgi:hypothetical protein
VSLKAVIEFNYEGMIEESHDWFLVLNNVFLLIFTDKSL